jgi:hypothetical protein
MVDAGSPDPRQHPFESGHDVPIRPVIRALSGGGASTAMPGFPLPFGSLAFASRIVLRPPEGRPSLRSAHQAQPALGPRRGCHVPHQTDTAGKGALSTPGTVVRSRPTRFARAAPVAFQRPAPTSRWNIPPSESRSSRGVNEDSRDSPVRPSPACDHRMERRSLGTSSGFAPHGCP